MKLQLPLIQNFPYLLIQKGKYGNFYYHIDREETFQASLLNIFNTQKDNGYYDYLCTDVGVGDMTNRIALLTLDIEKLKELLKLDGLTSDLKHRAECELNSKSRSLKNELERLEDSKILRKILDGDHSLIYKFLINRLDYEYEAIEAETYSK